MTNGHKKGDRGELELAHYLESRGHPSYRSQQFCGRGENASDVITKSLPVHWESKRTEALSLYPAMAQAIRDADEGKIPVVAHRRNHKDWLAILRLEDFIKLFPAPPAKEEGDDKL